jgi:hypothetical protein
MAASADIPPPSGVLPRLACHMCSSTRGHVHLIGHGLQTDPGSCTRTVIAKEQIQQITVRG